MKAASDKSRYFLTTVKFLGHIFEGNTINPLESRLVAILSFQPSSKKKKIQAFLVMLIS